MNEDLVLDNKLKRYGTIGVCKENNYLKIDEKEDILLFHQNILN